MIIIWSPLSPVRKQPKPEMFIFCSGITENTEGLRVFTQSCKVSNISILYSMIHFSFVFKQFSSGNHVTSEKDLDTWILAIIDAFLMLWIIKQNLEIIRFQSCSQSKAGAGSLNSADTLLIQQIQRELVVLSTSITLRSTFPRTWCFSYKIATYF